MLNYVKLTKTICLFVVNLINNGNKNKFILQMITYK